jgi:alkanesulfonate monooxygenase SsuD/methylene tetrahydromethanopterin reductase-like flavin-dependent oxidoreductase (luciferase family)
VSTRNEHLILSAAIAGSGHHPGAAARSPQALDVAHFRYLVQTTERGLLDFVFLYDKRALPDAAVTGSLDALSVLARLAPETRFIGLAVSVPTTYSEPFNVSRALATLDFVSRGRAAWNATSSRSDAEAHNFGKTYAPDADARRSLAEAFIEISRKLWDSWEDDLARQLASLDHVSDGRAAWNVVTTFSNSAAKDSGGDQVAYNFSKEKHLDHATRYDRAREFVTLIKNRSLPGCGHHPTRGQRCTVGTVENPGHQRASHRAATH